MMSSLAHTVEFVGLTALFALYLLARRWGADLREMGRAARYGPSAPAH